MITIDRSASTSVQDQLVEQLRYHIASGHFKIGETLPSTRTLGQQLGISFHTVRKAYQVLEQEGLLESRVGSGFLVKERVPLSKAERMERGAAVVHDALQRLIGLGLAEAEIEYLVAEQLQLLEGSQDGLKLVFAAPYREMAELCAEQMSLSLQQAVEPATLDEVAQHQDADYLFASYPDLRAVMERAPRADVIGVVTYLKPDALERVARLLSHQTLGLVTRSPDAIGPLSAQLRAETRFDGQILAAPVSEEARHLEGFLRQTDLVVYTPVCRRRLLPLLGEGRPHAAVASLVSRDSLEAIRQLLPV